MRKRLITLLASLVFSTPLAMLVTTAPASAAVPACNAITGTAVWSGAQSFSYTPGHWCMKDAFTEVIFQGDGNLVWYKLNDGRVLFSSNTCRTCRPGQVVRNLAFQTDGNVVVYRSTGAAMWAIGTGIAVNHSRTSPTHFTWQVERVVETCGFSNFKFYLKHQQTSPDHNLKFLTACQAQ